MAPFPPNLSKCHLCIELGNVKLITSSDLVGGFALQKHIAGMLSWKILVLLLTFCTFNDRMMCKMCSCVQRGVFSSLMAVKWKAKTVYHNQKEKETKNQASRQFDLVLQPVGVGPFLPKCILRLLGLSY